MRRWVLLLMISLLCLVLRPVLAQTSPGDDYFVEATISNPSPFVGEQIIYTFRLYTVDQFDQPASYLPPDFEGFWRTDIRGERDSTAQVNGRYYSVKALDTALYPTHEGNLIIEPGALDLSATVFADARRVPTNPVQVQVRPLPEGAPENFDGAVGQFSMQATLDRQTLEQGQPFTLQITVTGTGNVEQLNAPDLNWPEQWRVYTNPTDFQTFENNSMLVGVKSFEWLLSPTETGTLTLPPVSLAYFDPSDLVYKTVSTGDVTLNVLPSSQPEAQITIAPAPASALTLKTIESPLRTGEDRPSLFFWVLWIVPPALFAAAWLWLRQQQLVPTERPAQRKQAAFTHAQRQLKQAEKAAPGEASKLLRESLLGYLGAFWGSNVSEIDQYELQSRMRDANFDDRLIEGINTYLDWANSLEYAPEASADVRKLVERGQQILAALDKAWAKLV
ncbi:MAG: BatD family protein [Anaerolineae bacterium]|nr:BatD family protein [Anaerolineae bacterium]